MHETLTELMQRIENLETRLTYQDAAVETLTRNQLAQERQLREQAEVIKRLTEQLRALSASPVGAEPDSPPPHY